MKGTNLGEFEEMVLLSVAILSDGAYGNSIKEELTKRLGRNPSIGALHASLGRLEEKGFLESKEGETTPERGGRRRRYYMVTKTGVRAIQQAKDLRDSMWKSMPQVILDLGKR
jgi:DNA-binding PadR family transcriptional regulator